MKTSDLMIGDWVYLVKDYGKVKKDILKLDVLELYRISDGMLEVEPIPLTPEILKKNGFYYGYTSNEEDLASNTIAQLSEDDKGWCWDEGDGAIKVIFPNEADGGLIILDDQSFDKHLVMGFSEIVYVHQLQHALRLCGIDKEIVL